MAPSSRCVVALVLIQDRSLTLARARRSPPSPRSRPRPRSLRPARSCASGRWSRTPGSAPSSSRRSVQMARRFSCTVPRRRVLVRQRCVSFPCSLRTRSSQLTSTLLSCAQPDDYSRLRERQLLYIVSVPGETDWLKQVRSCSPASPPVPWLTRRPRRISMAPLSPVRPLLLSLRMRNRLIHCKQTCRTRSTASLSTPRKPHLLRARAAASTRILPSLISVSSQRCVECLVPSGGLADRVFGSLAALRRVG